MIKPIPDGYPSVTPYLIIRGAAEAIEFYKRAFGATERMRLPMPDGRIGHAEIVIGDSPVMLADEMLEMDIRGPLTIGGSPVTLMVYVDDVDKVYATALAAGATVKRPLEDQFYGDRMGGVTDPFGHVWHLGTHKEDVSIDEMKRRMNELYGDKKAKASGAE